MNKQKKQKNQYAEPKDQQTNLQKLTGTLYRLFVKEQKLSTEVSHAVVTASYFQIFSIVNVILLFTVFSNTNSSTYTIIISSLCILIIVIDIFPRISKKHFVFNFVSITEGLILIGIIVCSKILLENYSIFIDHCQYFAEYSGSRSYVIGPSQGILAMCKLINTKFVAEIIVESAFVIGKSIHVVLYIRAYRQAKEKFDEDEKKKRRKDRYNQMMRRRYVFNEKRIT